MQLLAERFPGLFICFSHQVSPRVGVSGCISPTAVSLIVGPILSGYLSSLVQNLRRMGFVTGWCSNPTMAYFRRYLSASWQQDDVLCDCPLMFFLTAVKVDRSHQAQHHQNHGDDNISIPVHWRYLTSASQIASATRSWNPES